MVSDITEQNLHPAEKNQDLNTSVNSGIIQHTLATNAISNTYSSVPSVLKDLCILLDEDVKEDFDSCQQFDELMNTTLDKSDLPAKNFSRRITFRIQGEPLVEYHNMDKILSGLFPFIFHQGYNRNSAYNGPLNQRDRCRLFLFHDCVCAENLTLITYIFDCMRRQSCMRGAIFKTKRNYSTVHKTFQSFKSFLSSLPDNADILSKEYAKRLSSEMKKLKRVINFFSPPVTWGPFERNRNISKFYAMGQFLGSSAIFMTISPTMMDNIQCVELCLRNSIKTKIAIPIDKYIRALTLQDRRLLVTSNPIAQSVAFHQLIQLFSKSCLKLTGWLGITSRFKKIENHR